MDSGWVVHDHARVPGVGVGSVPRCRSFWLSGTAPMLPPVNRAIRTIRVISCAISYRVELNIIKYFPPIISWAVEFYFFNWREQICFV